MEKQQEYELDKEIPDKIWNNYLRKYEKDYKIQKGLDGIIEIKCKRGKIHPYSIMQKKLMFWGSYGSIKAKNNFFKRLNSSSPHDYKITQDCETETVIVFKEEMLDKISNIIEAKKTRKLSEKQLETLAKHRILFKKQE